MVQPLGVYHTYESVGSRGLWLPSSRCIAKNVCIIRSVRRAYNINLTFRKTVPRAKYYPLFFRENKKKIFILWLLNTPLLFLLLRGLLVCHMDLKGDSHGLTRLKYFSYTGGFLRKSEKIFLFCFTLFLLL